MAGAGLIETPKTQSAGAAEVVERPQQPAGNGVFSGVSAPEGFRESFVGRQAAGTTADVDRTQQTVALPAGSAPTTANGPAGASGTSVQVPEDRSTMLGNMYRYVADSAVGQFAGSVLHAVRFTVAVVGQVGEGFWRGFTGRFGAMPAGGYRDNWEPIAGKSTDPSRNPLLSALNSGKMEDVKSALEGIAKVDSELFKRMKDLFNTGRMKELKELVELHTP